MKTIKKLIMHLGNRCIKRGVGKTTLIFNKINEGLKC